MRTNVKTINQIIAYLMMAVGITKIFIIVFSLTKGLEAAGIVFNGGTANFQQGYTLNEFFKIIGYSQLILVPVSIIMIIFNFKCKISVITGYIFSIVAFGLDILSSGFLTILFVSISSGLYIKAATSILKENEKMSELYY